MSGITIGIGFGTARTGVPTPAEICSYAERAEDLGIDSIWLSDRITGAQLDIACVMALFAARTKKIKMGPSVLTLPAHNPVHVARSYATLDHLTGGRRRIIMAVGIGNDPKQCLAAGIPVEERGAPPRSGQLVPGAPEDLYAALGLGGQVVMVDPGSGTVVVRLGTLGADASPTAGAYSLGGAAKVVTEALTQP